MSKFQEFLKDHQNMVFVLEKLVLVERNLVIRKMLIFFKEVNKNPKIGSLKLKKLNFLDRTVLRTIFDIRLMSRVAC